jgi:mannose-6-phosphate isomerase-like protein (cupin superfamily)
MIKPVKRILLSDKDRYHLKNIRDARKMKCENQPDNYKDKVVVKPWGYEFLTFENEWVAIWFLHIKKDHSTSMHCHPSKKTSLILLSGKGLCNTFRHRNFLSSGDALIIEAAAFHSTKALSLDGISLIEVETPPRKLDLIRLEDKYNRENCGYEGCSQMTTENLDDFEHFCFKGVDCHGSKFTQYNRFSISIERYPSEEAFRSSFTADPGSAYCVCKGAVLAPNGSVAVDVGEVERGAYLQQLGRVGIDEETILMKFVVFH